MQSVRAHHSTPCEPPPLSPRYVFQGEEGGAACALTAPPLANAADGGAAAPAGPADHLSLSHAASAPCGVDRVASAEASLQGPAVALVARGAEPMIDIGLDMPAAMLLQEQVRRRRR